METARMVTPPATTLMMESTSTTTNSRTSAAVEIAVDAYATRVLMRASPAEACIDESLGPYVTSLLRCSLHNGETTTTADVSNIPEFDSLLELLEEHCSLSPESATEALTTIAAAVKTGVVPPEQRRHRNSSFDGSSFRNTSNTMSTTESSYHVDPDTLFSLAAETNATQSSLDDFPPLSDAQDRAEACGKGRTPLKEDRLIPVDLLGALDDPSTPPVTKSNQDATSSSRIDEGFPPLGSTPLAKKQGSSNSIKGKKSSKKRAGDLAAILFRSSRVRQSSIDSDSVSRSTTSVGSGGQSSSEAQQIYHSQTNQYFQQQCDVAVEMLLTMNPELGEEAATEAALMANGDANLSQYLINQAMQAPPVCRHLLSGACYRSDCQFSHDVEGHTCLFWIRGRCGKGPSCRFLHGFSDKAFDLVHEWSNHTLSPEASSAPVTISTGNLVSHNMNTAFSAPQHDSNPFASFQPGSHLSSSSSFDAGSFSMPSSWIAPSSLETGMQSLHVDSQKRTPNNEGSFASIASKGYHSGESFTPEDATASHIRESNFQLPKGRTVRIPQELWNPHINRDSHMFHIQDPIERYKAVSGSSSNGRSDVLDLHFQSTKTFPVVLANVLPRMLEDNDEVWVVTGTGHHVSKNTHQQGGGALENAVLSWLSHEGYDYIRGRDRNGHGGAVLVKRL